MTRYTIYLFALTALLAFVAGWRARGAARRPAADADLPAGSPRELERLYRRNQADLRAVLPARTRHS